MILKQSTIFSENSSTIGLEEIRQTGKLTVKGLSISEKSINLFTRQINIGMHNSKLEMRIQKVFNKQIMM